MAGDATMQNAGFPGGIAVAPVSYRLEYHARPSDGAAGAAHAIELDAFEGFATQDLELDARFDGEVLSFALTPRVPLEAESFRVTLAHGFTWGEKILLNGYQSWTTTEWLPVYAGMRGLGGVPLAVLDKYAIDGIGDYRFVDYGRGRGHLHGFTYGVCRRKDAYALVGSLDESHGFTLIRTNASEGRIELETECPQRVLLPGQTVQLGAYALVTGSEDWVYDRWFELMGVKARPVRPLVGYSSWYKHYGDIDQAKLAADFEGAYVGLMDVKLGNAQRVFQVDDGYCKVGDWLRVDAAKFPRGLAPLATRATAAGFLPGLWVSPFVCEAQSWLFAQHPDWLMRDEAGQLVRTGPHWSGAYALDTRNPEVRSYVRQVLQTLTCDWGFKLLKLDFLYAACMVPHDGMNRGELMADAMRLLREAAGEDVLLLGCGVPLASAFGVVDYCRIGCDVGLDWDDKPHMRLLHRERVSTKNSLRNTVSRAPLDGRAFGNDPDVFFLRSDLKLSEKRRLLLLEADAHYGSVLLTSDDMSEWDAIGRARFRNALRVLLSRKR